MTTFTAIDVRKYDCPECNFRKNVDASRIADGRSVPTRRTCPTCSGAGVVVLDSAAVRSAIVSSRGAQKGLLRKSRPALPSEKNGVYGAAYVWRMIRFNSGLDMHIPVMVGDYAGLIGSLSNSDPVLRGHLHFLVKEFGVELFGVSDSMRGAGAWARVRGAVSDEVARATENTVGLL